MSLVEAFRPWRRFFLSEAEVAERVARVEALVASASESDLHAAEELATETLVCDPYNPALHIALARLAAARGNAEAYGSHVAAAFRRLALTKEDVLGDAGLRGKVRKAQVIEAIRAATRSVGADRVRDFCFDEIAPETRTYATTLRWPMAHQEAVCAAYVRMAERSDAAHRHVFPDDATFGTDCHHVKDGALSVETDTIPGAFLHLGNAVELFREVAPYVEDVRLFVLDQVGPLDEIWIVDHAFYIRRHPIDVDDFGEAARYLDDLLRTENIEDQALGRYVAMRLTHVAGGAIDVLSSPWADPVELRREAEDMMARVVRYEGEEPPYLRARLQLRDGDRRGAILSLRGAVERWTDDAYLVRKPLLELSHLYAQDAEHAEVLAVTDRLVALGDRADEDVHLRRAQALTALGRREEALAAYARHGRVIDSYSGILLSNARAALREHEVQGAALMFAPILKAGGETGTAARRGLARCTELLGEVEIKRLTGLSKSAKPSW